jgi:hypothetical protein
VKKLKHKFLQGDYRQILVVTLLTILTILMVMRNPTDPDLGWHLRNGQDILKYGVPHGDLYSYTMSGYPWISHEWITDVLLYLGSKYWGLFALSTIFGCIVFLAYFITARIKKTSPGVALLAVMIAALVSISIFGVRPQMLTLLGVAITMWLLFKWRDNPKSNLIYWLIPLFLVWANLHGGFAAGLLLIGLFWVIELIKYCANHQHQSGLLTSKQLVQLLMVGLMAGLSTLINPYTWGIYDELLKTVFNEVVKNGISEWRPVNFQSIHAYNLIIYAAFLAILLIFNWRKVDITKLAIGATFLLISLSSWRHLPLFALVTLPLLIEMMNNMLPRDLKKYYYSLPMILGLIGLIIFIFLTNCLSIFRATSDETAFATSGFPYYAVQYIKTHYLPGNMFNEYNWGGYLIWKLPEKRVFIDGRMAIWKDEEHNVFADYINLGSNSKQIKEVLDKYKVAFALVYKNRTFKNYFLENNQKWHLVYEDSLAMIFQRTVDK